MNSANIVASYSPDCLKNSKTLASETTAMRAILWQFVTLMSSMHGSVDSGSVGCRAMQVSKETTSSQFSLDIKHVKKKNTIDKYDSVLFAKARSFNEDNTISDVTDDGGNGSQNGLPLGRVQQRRGGDGTVKLLAVGDPPVARDLQEVAALGEQIARLARAVGARYIHDSNLKPNLNLT